MSATMTNGKLPRKQLADQIDRLEQVLESQCARLDSIADGLAEGLPEAVAVACKDGARQAVRDAVIEILSNPELRTLLAKLHAAPSAPVPPAPEPEYEPAPKKPSLWSRIKAKAASVSDSLAGVPAQVKAAVAAKCKGATDALDALGQATGEMLKWRRVLWIGAGVGVATGVVSLVAPHAVSAAIGAAGAATTTVAVQAGLWFKRAARFFSLTN